MTIMDYIRDYIISNISEILITSSKISIVLSGLLAIQSPDTVYVLMGWFLTTLGTILLANDYFDIL